MNEYNFPDPDWDDAKRIGLAILVIIAAILVVIFA